MGKDEDLIYITDEDGNEFTFKILFTYTHEERETQYVFFYDENDEDGEVMFARYLDDGSLEYIEDEEEIAEVEEVFNAFNDELDEEVNA